MKLVKVSYDFFDLVKVPFRNMKVEEADAEFERRLKVIAERYRSIELSGKSLQTVCSSESNATESELVWCARLCAQLRTIVVDEVDDQEEVGLGLSLVDSGVSETEGNVQLDLERKVIMMMNLCERVSSRIWRS
jgi:hypothetical protein